MNLEEFFENNKKKPFFINLKKYNKLDRYGKMKVVSSILTNLYINSENCASEELIEFEELQKELITILYDIQYFNIDNFMQWLGDKL
jgi:hypothetical protein